MEPLYKGHIGTLENVLYIEVVRTRWLVSSDFPVICFTTNNEMAFSCHIISNTLLLYLH